MQSCDIPVFAALMAGMGELYSKRLSEALMDMYWHALKQFDVRDVHRALKSHINNPEGGQFFPKPADVVRYITGCHTHKALRAWSKVEKTMATVGAYYSVEFDDLLIHAVLDDMGGWIKLCSLTETHMHYRAHEFQKRYQGFINTPPAHYPKYLSGILERDNAQSQHKSRTPPVLIGDQHTAEQVMLTGGGTSLSHPLSPTVHVRVHSHKKQ